MKNLDERKILERFEAVLDFVKTEKRSKNRCAYEREKLLAIYNLLQMITKTLSAIKRRIKREILEKRDDNKKNVTGGG